MWMKRTDIGELDLRWPVFRNDAVVASKNEELQVNP